MRISYSVNACYILIAMQREFTVVMRAALVSMHAWHGPLM